MEVIRKNNAPVLAAVTTVADCGAHSEPTSEDSPISFIFRLRFGFGERSA